MSRYIYLKEKEAQKRGCVYCMDAKRSKLNGYIAMICPYDECPYSELDDETFEEYLDKNFYTIEDKYFRY